MLVGQELRFRQTTVPDTSESADSRPSARRLAAIIEVMREMSCLPWPVPLPEVDDPEIGDLLRHVGDALGGCEVLLELKCNSSGDRRRYGSDTQGSSPALELETDGTVAAALRMDCNGETPPSGALNLASLALRAILGRHRLGQRTRLLGDAMSRNSSAIILFDAQGEIMYANDAADRLLSQQTEMSLDAQTGEFRAQPLFGLLCALAERSRTRGLLTWKGELALSDGSSLFCEMMIVNARGPYEKDGAWTILRAPIHSGGDCLGRFARENQLSPRETDVLQHLVLGQGTLAIAETLGISHHTVRDHLKHLYRKTGTNSRNELLSRIAVAAMASGESVIRPTPSPGKPNSS